MNFQLSFIDIIGSIIGLFYIVSEYRAGRWFWPWSLLMSLFYIIIDYSSGYYANGTICVYNFIMSLYGIMVWRGVIQSSTKQEKPFGSCPMRMVPYILVAVALLSVALWWLLGKVGESQYPWLDGISSALSIVGMWMLAQKWWQQWFCWMIVEPLMVVLFWMGGNYASALLYVIYEVFCVLGLISWRRRAMKEGLGEPEDTVRMSKL
jgi:nicotinamide mononucleotide transporter